MTVEKELGLAYGEHRTALGDGFVVGAMFIVAAWVPVFPYKVRTALVVSLAATAIALVCVGTLKGQIAGLRRLRSALHVLAVGAPPRSSASSWPS